MAEAARLSIITCEATLKVAKQTEILRLIHKASFLGLFVGIEHKDCDALKAMRKDHNNSAPNDGRKS